MKDPNPQKAKQIADAVSEQFSKQVAQIETPPGAKTSPVKVSVVQPATLPSSPVSPKTKLDLALGLLIGLIIGIGGAVLRAKLDNRIHDRDEAAKAADASVLATLSDDEAVEERPLIVQDEVFSPRVEAFRRLRTNIRFVGVDDTLRALVVTSADPGEGKTTVASNLAIALAQAGEKVILVDADMRHPKVAERFGLNPATGLSRALFEPDNVDRFLQGWRDDLPLRILTSGPTPPNPTELLGSHRMRQLIEALKARSTVIIFDSPPLLPVSDAAVLATFTDGALLVARANHTRRDSLAHAAEALHAVDAQVLGVVLNRVRATGGRCGRYGGYGRYGRYDAYGPAEQARAPKLLGRLRRRKTTAGVTPTISTEAVPAPAPVVPAQRSSDSPTTPKSNGVDRAIGLEGSPESPHQQ